MIRQKGSAVLLIAVLIASVVALGLTVASTWQTAKAKAGRGGAIDSATAENLPPRLDSDEAKASLFYPVMKSRGPQPGGKLIAKPLEGNRGPEVR